jgi:hypothetical protein
VFKNKTRLIGLVAILVAVILPVLLFYIGFNQISKASQSTQDSSQVLASSQPVEENADTSEVDIKLELKESDIQSLDNLKIQIPVDITYPDSAIGYLQYSLNQQETQKLTVESGQDFINLELLPRTSHLQYQLVIETNSEIYTYPQDPVVLTSNPFAELGQALQDLEKTSGNKIHLSLIDTHGNDFSYKGDQVVGALSLIKVPVMIETYNQIDQDQIKVTDRVSRYGYAGTVETALSDMIHHSSNEATGALIQHLGGIEPINATVLEVLDKETTNIYLDHTPGYGTAENWQKYNQITTDELSVLISKIQNLEVISLQASQQMLDLMSDTDDYLDIVDSKGLASIKMKTGYYPPIMYGLTGVVETTQGEAYTITIMIDNWSSKKAINLSQMQTLLEVVNSEMQTPLAEG